MCILGQIKSTMSCACASPSSNKFINFLLCTNFKAKRCPIYNIIVRHILFPPFYSSIKSFHLKVSFILVMSVFIVTMLSCKSPTSFCSPFTSSPLPKTAVSTASNLFVASYTSIIESCVEIQSYNSPKVS
jgi:hypothetical protein